MITQAAFYDLLDEAAPFSILREGEDSPSCAISLSRGGGIDADVDAARLRGVTAQAALAAVNSALLRPAEPAGLAATFATVRFDVLTGAGAAEAMSAQVLAKGPEGPGPTPYVVECFRESSERCTMHLALVGGTTVTELRRLNPNALDPEVAEWLSRSPGWNGPRPGARPRPYGRPFGGGTPWFDASRAERRR